MLWYFILLIMIGITIVLDGIGSALIQGGQYHTFWFDGERYARAAAGIAVIVLAMYACYVN
jgi:hypothetical protein